MRKFKLFFACLLMAVLSIGQMWATDYYVKVTSAPVDWSGDYLIVYETGNLAFDGGLETLDAVSNSISVTIDEGRIEATTTTNAAKFTIAAAEGGYTILSASGKNIGVGSWANGLKQDKAYVHNTFDVDEGGNATVGIYNDTWNTTGGTMKLNYNKNSGQTRFRYFKNGGQQAIQLYKFESSGGSSVTAPTVTPNGGNFVGTQSVTLTQADSKAIYYTTNGDDPTTDGTLYSDPFTLTGTATVKAAAYDGDADAWSDVVSKTFTKLDELATMDEIFAKATAVGTTATDVSITFDNWVVTGVKNSNAYVTDGTKGFIIYTSSHGFNVGDILSGTATCKVQLYNGSAELTELPATKVTVNTGGSVSPVVLDADGISALTGANTGSVIKISGACTYESSKYYIAGVQLYNQLYSFSVSAGTNYECTGVYVLNTSFGNEILPRSAADIVAQTSVATPTFSPAAGEYTEAQTVTITCATDGASIYYTTNGDAPTNASTPYTAAISVGASMTIKAIAYKGDDHSEVATAAYTINLPIPSHDFQITHYFSTGEGFEFPEGWGGSYAEHEIAFTDDKVVFASASKQSGTITDRPVVKEGAISLVLTNSHKLITAVRFDYSQWSDKVPTLTMKYSTDGGSTYNAFDPAVSSTEFALQVLDLPEGVNAIQVVGTANKQVGLTSIAFDLEDKPIVTKTVTITPPSNGTLVVKDGDDPITSGDDIEVGTTLTIVATPADGYILTEVTVNGSAYTEATLELTEDVTIAATFEENLAPLVTSYDLSELGVVTSHLNGERVGDKVNLPLTAATCSKTFVGWDANENCTSAPTYAPGAEYTLEADNTLYAVYASPVAGTTWDVATSVKAGDVVVISTNTGYTAHDMKTAGAIASSLFGCTASTYGSENAQITALAEGTLQFTVGGNATDGWTLMNGTKYLKVTAAKKVNLVDDEETWSISFSGNNATLAPATGDYTAYSVQYNYNSGNDRFTAYNTAQVAISLYKQAVSYENYSTECLAQVATPTFSPAAGVYTEAQNVTITCATAEATIYYTTNGDEPTTSSTEYTGAFTVDESKTIKAIAVKAGMENSAVASAEYTINLPVILTTMDAIFAKATEVGTTPTDVTITFGDWVVSGISTNGKSVYLTDGSKGLVIFDNGGSLGFSVGDILSGTVDCKVQKYNGFSELTTLTSSSTGLSISTGGVITPVVKAITELSGVNTGAPIIVNNVKYDGTNLVDASDNEIQPYTTLYADAVTSLTTNNYYNVTGIYTQYNSKAEILPRSAADIEEVALSDPELSYSPASESIEVGGSWSAPTFNNPHDLSPISYETSNDAVATVTSAGVIEIVATAPGTATITASYAGDATYNFGSATYTITVTNPAPTPTGTTYTKVTSTGDITDGEYLIVYETTGVAFDGSLETLDAEGNSVAVTINTGVIAGTTTIDAATFTIDVTAGTLQSASGKYIGVSSNSNGLKQTENAATYTHTFSIDGEGNAVILANFEGSTMKLRYNPSTSSGNLRFRYYKNDGQQDIQLYKKDVPTPPTADYTRDDDWMAPGELGTICIEHGVATIVGAHIYELSGKDASGNIVFASVDVMEPGVPYLFEATANRVDFFFSDATPVGTPNNSGAMKSTFESGTTLTGDGLNGVYYFNGRALWNAAVLDHLDVIPYRAYVYMPDVQTLGGANPAPGRRYITMSVHGENSATGIDDLNATDAPRKVMIEGTLYILRGEKVYDATGRLVK